MELRPQLNGQRVRNADPTVSDEERKKVYLILDGRLRWIPNPRTYDNLFRDWNGIAGLDDIENIEPGDPITDGAVLGKDHNFPPIYLLSFNQKRHITSPATMDKYHFSWDEVQEIRKVELDSIMDGDPID